MWAICTRQMAPAWYPGTRCFRIRPRRRRHRLKLATHGAAGQHDRRELFIYRPMAESSGRYDGSIHNGKGMDNLLPQDGHPYAATTPIRFANHIMIHTLWSIIPPSTPPPAGRPGAWHLQPHSRAHRRPRPQAHPQPRLRYFPGQSPPTARVWPLQLAQASCVSPA